MNAFPVYSGYDDPDFWLDISSTMSSHACQAPRMDDNSESWLGWLFCNENEMAWEEYLRRRDAPHLKALRVLNWASNGYGGVP